MYATPNLHSEEAHNSQANWKEDYLGVTPTATLFRFKSSLAQNQSAPSPLRCLHRWHYAMDVDIRNWPREQDYIIYLTKRRRGDPIPPGVFTQNPFTSNPWDFPEDSWYLFEESPGEWNREGNVWRTENGFWRWSSTVTVPTDSAFGFRNVFEFYQGNTPIGTRTGWMMHQYNAGQKREGASDVQDNSSLCRLFWNNDGRVNSSQPNNSPAACADFCTLGYDMITRKEGCEAPSRREADGNVLVNVSQDSFIEMNDLLSSDGEISELYDYFSDRDYLEFNDILTSDTASTSCGSNMSSDEHINIDELLGEIMRHDPVPVEDEEKVDCFSGFTEPVQLDQDDTDKLLGDGMSSGKENRMPYHFSNGDFLELTDLLPSDMASTGNLGCTGRNSAEYFNADELLRDIAKDGPASVEEQQEKPDCWVCTKNSIRSSLVSLTGTESVASCIGDAEAADKEQPPGLIPEEGPSTSSCSCASQVKRNLSDRSEGVSSSCSGGGGSSSTGSCNEDCNKRSSSKTQQSKRRKSVQRLAKIGKKFFCFS